MNLDTLALRARAFITELAPGYHFDWYNSKTEFGECCTATHVIRLSRPLSKLLTWPTLKQTILHEIAHAHAHEIALACPNMVKLDDGADDHGYIWRNAATNLGVRQVFRRNGTFASPPEQRARAFLAKTKNRAGVRKRA